VVDSTLRRNDKFNQYLDYRYNIDLVIDMGFIYLKSDAGTHIPPYAC
jgi:hypothetical protein